MSALISDCGACLTPRPPPTPQNFKNMAASSGPRWLKRRKLAVKHMFAKRQVELFEPLMLAGLHSNLSRFLDASQPAFNFRVEMEYFAADFIARVAMGDDADGFDIKRALRERNRNAKEYVKPQLWEISRWLGDTVFRGMKQRYIKPYRDSDAIYWEVVNRRWPTFDASAEPNDLLDAMLQQVANGTLDLESVVIMLRSDIFLAGTDTSTSAIEWVVGHFLAATPDKLARLRREIDSLGVPDSVLLSQSDLTPQQVPYLYAAIKETFRWAVDGWGGQAGGWGQGEGLGEDEVPMCSALGREEGRRRAASHPVTRSRSSLSPLSSRSRACVESRPSRGFRCRTHRLRTHTFPALTFWCARALRSTRSLAWWARTPRSFPTWTRGGRSGIYPVAKTPTLALPWESTPRWATWC